MDYHTPPAYQKSPANQQPPAYQPRPFNQQPMNQPQVRVSQQPPAQRTGGGIVSFPPPDLSGVITARSRLEAFKLNAQHMEKSIRSMFDTIKGMSTFYIQFTQSVIDPWFSAAPPKVSAADEILKFNGIEFSSLIDKLTNQLGPSFFNELKKHDATIKELWALEKNCNEALRNYEKKESEYKSEYISSSANLHKVDVDRDAYITSRKNLDQINSKFINDVYALEVGRSKDLTNAFKSFFAIFCQFINKAAKLKPIDFPSNPKDYFIEPESYVPPVSPKSSSNELISQQSSHGLVPTQTNQNQAPSSSSQPNTNFVSPNKS